jgi:hypothetical protein
LCISNYKAGRKGECAKIVREGGRKVKVHGIFQEGTEMRSGGKGGNERLDGERGFGDTSLETDWHMDTWR